jgi:glycosyltransferase involved in cell wall biosynthesis
MTPSVYLNGRFLTQSLTGVQRFSAEVTAAIDRLMTAGKWPETVILAPRSSIAGISNFCPGDYQRLRLKETGQTRGHVWEQTELPVAARGGILVNLGNTAPMLAGSRQIVVIHDAGVFDTPESYSLHFRAWYRALHHGLVRTGARVVTVSEFSRQRIATRLGLDPGTIAVMCEGADHILRVTADGRVLQRHGLRPREFGIVVGSRAAHKNLVALSEAAEAFQRRGFMIAVAGGSDPNVFRDTQAAGCLRHLGRVTDAELRALYENAACLLFPSGYEGFGLPPVEAMICGCPVLASGGGAVEEICGDAALYFAVDKKQTIIAAIDRLLDETDVAEDLRRRGHARAASLSWEASAVTLGGVIQSVQS